MTETKLLILAWRRVSPGSRSYSAFIRWCSMLFVEAFGHPPTDQVSLREFWRTLEEVDPDPAAEAWFGPRLEVVR